MKLVKMKRGEKYTDGRKVITVKHAHGLPVPIGWIKIKRK